MRETAADVLGQIAENMSKQQNMLLPGDTASSPVLRAAWYTMLEHKKELQQAGAYALSQACTLSSDSLALCKYKLLVFSWKMQCCSTILQTHARTVLALTKYVCSQHHFSEFRCRHRMV